ncbi:SEN34 endonuclease, partial [Atractosteus spatula]|nr:SEN34 endonuclease [Atractosteus spatula]
MAAHQGETGFESEPETGGDGRCKQPAEPGSEEEKLPAEPGLETDAAAARVYLCGSTPLLWRAADVRRVRERAGVVGTLIGSLARQPRQNLRLGRPAQLLPEEARLLRDTGRAVLVTAASPEAEDGVRAEEVERYRERLQHSFLEQKKIALEDRKQVLQRVMNQKQRDGGAASAEQPLRDRLSSLESSFTFPEAATAVQLCTARARLGYEPEERLLMAGDWPQPCDERMEARYRVYRDLRRRGYYVTPAGKFGGDYLVYPGDPLRFHAHFIAVCLPPEAETPLSDLLALSRLGSNVKKTVLLCSPGESGGVVYTSLQWSGMV